MSKNNLAFTIEDEERLNEIKEGYQKLLPFGIRKFLRKTFIFRFARCYFVAKEKTFYPGMPRKCFVRRYFDNVLWAIKYKRVNTTYNRYGLDIKNFRKASDYLEIHSKSIDQIKEHHKGHPMAEYREENVAIRYSILADHKHLFYSYMESIMPGSVPKTNLVFQGDMVIAPVDKTKNLEQSLLSLPDGKYICKPALGSQGNLIFSITKKGKNLKFSDKEINIERIVEESKDSPFLVQEFLSQHKELNKFNGETVNTLRIVSTRWNEETHILAGMIRISAKKDQVVDNASAGGTFVGIDIENGTLREYGYFYDQTKTTHHPVSNIKYEGFKIPYWKETIELIKTLHPIIFGFAAIGWDIAITPDGPVIVEINQRFSVKGLQICNGGLRKKWEEFKEK